MRDLEVPVDKESVKVAVATDATTYLGRVVWYGVPQQTIPYADLERRLTAESVPRSLWPSKTRASDAFKAAVRVITSKEHLVEYETYVDGAGRKQTDRKTLLVVDRIHDQSTDSLPVALKVRFFEHRGSGQLHFVRSPRLDHAKATVLENQIQAAFDVFRNSYRDDDIRSMIKRALLTAYAKKIRKTGGIYFVPEEGVAGVDAIARVVEDLGGGAEMVSLPVVDTDPNRKTILRRYEKATLERIEEMMLQVRDLVAQGGAIVPSVLARFVDEADYLREQKEKYTEILRTSMGSVDVKEQLLRQALQQLAGLVKSK